MNKFLCWALVLTGFIYSACDDDDNDANVSDRDRTFVAKAAEANQSEIELGTLAASNSTSPEVQAFGQKMSTEHRTALDELNGIASSKNISLPGTLNDTHKALMMRLQNLSGMEFDTAYVNSQVKDHALVESFFQIEINGGEDQQLKDYASKYLPAIQQHKTEAEALLIVLQP